MSDYLDRVERQLVQRADALYAPRTGQPSAWRRARGGLVARSAPGLDALGVLGRGGWPRRRGSWSVVGVTMGTLAGLVAAAFMLLGGSPVAPDFTVVRGKGRVITIKASTSADVSAVNRRLARLGIPIRVARRLPTCTTRGAKLSVDQASMPVVRRLPGDPRALLAVRVRPPTRPGQTLVLSAGEPGGNIVAQLISGATAMCATGAPRGPALLGAPS